MKKTQFKVDTSSLEDYNEQLEEFREMMEIWIAKEAGRSYEIETDINNLKFKIIASNGEN